MMSKRVSLLCTGLLIVAYGCGDDGATNDGSGSADSTGSTSAGPTSSSTTTTTGVSATDTTDTSSTATSADTSASTTATTGGTTTGVDTTGSGTDSGSGSDTSATTGDTTGGGGMVNCPPGGNDTTLTGTVWAPNGEIPVSGALVYTSQDMPDGIPQQVYCAECEELQCDDVETFTAADGTFTLNTNADDANYLVVQKGQFLRVSPINYNPGNVAVADTLTTLPDYNDPQNGLYIPLIAVGDGSYDRLEDALGKFGLGDTMIQNFEERLVPGTEPFDLWDNGQDPVFDGFQSQGTFAQLVGNPANLAQYHIIFVPCSSDTFVASLTQQNIDNIRDWVAAGGRWYVADWSNEWLEHVFPEYQTLEGEPNNADIGVYDSLGTVLDQGLLDWLNALPPALQDINPLNDEIHPTLNALPQVQTVDNWSVILDTPPVLVDDGMGGQIDVGHKVWLEGPGGQGAVGDHPLTVTGQHGCGKLQFTSYHTAEFFDYVGLSPQELVLVYTILEIGVCQDVAPS